MASPFSGTKTKDNIITVDFDPSVSTTATACSEIVDIQFVRITADGSSMKPGTYYSQFVYRDAVTTDANWSVDFHKGEKTPDYQQAGLVGAIGFKNDLGSKNAWIPDAPQTGGGDEGFYDLLRNPKGWKTVVIEFRTFCWCMKGTQCASWYEGLSWTFTKTWEDQRDSKTGKAEVVNNDIAPPPADELIAAFDKFNSNFGFVPCSTTTKAVKAERAS